MKLAIKFIVIILLAIVAGGALLFAYASWKVSNDLRTTYPLPNIDGLGRADAEAVARGRRIVTIRNGCVECHGANLAGAVVIDDPAMGRIVGSNITPFALGKKSDEQVARAIRHGLNSSGRPLVFMPSYEYQNLSKDDLVAVIGYLRSVPEVRQPNQTIRIGPMAKILYALGQLPTLVPAGIIDHTRGFPGKPREEPSVAFGNYLATSSCTGCHGISFRGGPIPGAPPDWLPASNIRFGKGSSWTEQDFTRAMKTGFSKRKNGKLAFPFPLALTSQMNATELKALWLYLSSLEHN